MHHVAHTSKEWPIGLFFVARGTASNPTESSPDETC